VDAASAGMTWVRAGGSGVPTDHPSRLVLWDIDHTLIETRGLGRQLYRRAFETVTGRKIEREADVTGQTEPAILAATLKLHGIEDDEPFQVRYAEALAAEYEKHRDELRQRGRALPGAREALVALAGRSNVVQTVLSGNLRTVSMIKLRVFELDRYIDFEAGAYGDDDTHRPKLVAIAQERAGRRNGVKFTRSNTVIVGDSVQDVETGREGGAAVMAVASGRDDATTLRTAGAKVVWPDLTDIDRVVQALLP
jgi:phosphoglycolate phosphatase-like HAD superfamily hydrolase